MAREFNERNLRRAVVRLEDPPAAQALFGDTRWAWLWLFLRLYAGYEWVTAGYEKLTSPVWTGAQSGAALSGFVKGALSKSSGPHADVQGWYASFLQHAVLANPAFWSHLVAWGEFLVGVALVLGAFTGIAAFFGAFMNMNYLLAGTVSTNPFLLVVAFLLVLAWKTAGWIGLDHWILPALGTPWAPGLIFHRSETPPPPQRGEPA